MQLEACLGHIFSKYCTPLPQKRPGLLVPPEGAHLTPQALDEWAKDTNGTAFDQESKDELLTFMDCTEDGGLTWVTGGNPTSTCTHGATHNARFEGFLQVYQLQTECDEEETWKDLVSVRISVHHTFVQSICHSLVHPRFRSIAQTGGNAARRF